MRIPWCSRRGREYRSEFHINPSDETMQMIKGEMRLHYRTADGKEAVAEIPEPRYLYAGGNSHSPRFSPEAFALISERKRRRARRSLSLVLREVRSIFARRKIHRARLC